MISTKNLLSFPDRRQLRQICKSISVLDAIFAEEWVYRYYSFNSKWSDGEEFFEMRNGEGDHILILFLDDGCVINGMMHEYSPKDKTRLTQGLPEKYHEFIFGEPVHSIGTTFCVWTARNEAWSTGEVHDFNDGSEDVLKIFDGNPQSYLDWAIDYFELELADADAALSVITLIYQGKMLKKEMVYALNESFEHWQQLKSDLVEIDYPFQAD